MVYYEQRPPDDRDNPPGCLDALAMTRAVFGVLVWPLAFIFVVIFDVSITFYLYATRPVLALIPVLITAAAIWALVRWERHRFRPPEDL